MMAAYNQTMRQEESRMQQMMQRLSSSPYMPSRDQMIQLLTTVITLMLMMFLGPAAGAQAGVINAIVRQFVPLLVAASVHYAADSAVPMKPDLPQVAAQLASQPIEPVATAPLGPLARLA